MVISFEEKDRKKIEATGMTVIQVKKAFYIIINVIRDALKAVIEYYDSLSPEQKAELLKSINTNEIIQQGDSINNCRSIVPP